MHGVTGAITFGETVQLTQLATACSLYISHYIHTTTQYNSEAHHIIYVDLETDSQLQGTNGNTRHIYQFGNLNHWRWKAKRL